MSDITEGSLGLAYDVVISGLAKWPEAPTQLMITPDSISPKNPLMILTERK